MKLNLACGDKPRFDHVNVDLRSGNVIADVAHLPFRDGTFDRLLADDILEHFWITDAVPLLREWRRVAANGARLSVKVPNLTALAERLLKGDADVHVIRNIYGGHRWGPGGTWDAHHWGYTPDMLRDVLSEGGWLVAHNDEELNMRAEALAA